MLNGTQIIRVDAKENVRKQIVRELQVGHDCSSPYVITFYGAFQNEARDIVLCMEYMDCGWVTLYRQVTPFATNDLQVFGSHIERFWSDPRRRAWENHRINTWRPCISL